MQPDQDHTRGIVPDAGQTEQDAGGVEHDQSLTGQDEGGAEPDTGSGEPGGRELEGLRLGEILLHLQRVGMAELEQALASSGEAGARIGEHLVQRGLITEDDLLTALSLQLGIEYNQDVLRRSVSLSENLSRSFIKRHQVILLGERNGYVEVAIHDPFQPEVIENIKTFTGREVRLVLARKLDIMKLADVVAGEDSESAGKVIQDLSGEEENIEIMGETGEAASDMLDLANEAPIIKLVNLMITEALKSRASDIHVEPSEEGVQVRYRIDGVLYNVLTPPKRYQQALVSRIKIMADLNIAENRLPQDGRIKVKYGTTDVDVRVSVIPSVMGERVVMRLLVKDESRFNLDTLGIAPNQIKRLRELLKVPHGILIVSGPTGSGKTTTLYGCLREINTPEKNIITIEDPVEYRIAGISQIQVNPRIDLTFARGLRSILRQDPEVIMVGEIRDRETAEIAIQAAMTGHLVLSTVHTNDAASGVVRLLDMGIEPYLIASTVSCFMSQRLVRVLCDRCRVPADLEPAVLAEEGIDPALFESREVYRAEGCSACRDTGFQDRVGIFEMIPVDQEVRRMIIEKRDAATIRERCVSRGMRTMLHEGLDKVLQGVTSLEEVMRVIRE
ncbi:MAG: type II secretion system ATPase GspE [Spirochaetota bacterium]